MRSIWTSAARAQRLVLGLAQGGLDGLREVVGLRDLGDPLQVAVVELERLQAEPAARRRLDPPARTSRPSGRRPPRARRPAARSTRTQARGMDLTHKAGQS